MTLELEKAIEESPTPAGRPPRPPRTPKQQRPPLPPRRAPRPPKTYAPLTPRMMLVRGSLMIVAALLFSFVANVMVLSQVQNLVSQQLLYNEFRQQLSDGTAPVSEGNFDDVLLADGDPVAVIDIPQLDVHDVVVEGTSGDALKAGPGHRRDTVLPGQQGVSVLMGRAAAYGGPFGRIQELAPGDSFTVRTGQGKHVFEVVGVRYAGDPTPASPKAGESRLILQTARGASFIPAGIAYVDAQLRSEVQASGQRQTTFATLPPQAQAMATDPTTVWALVFALQFLVVAQLAAVWAYRRIGAQKTWVVFVPVGVLAVIFVSNQLTLLLPNLL
ncbi:sortase [Conyzicola sp.]|uniref:sortase n=1 Tax=Conyzicola sp. TaxID=1969404 RepID=UPI003988C22E